MNKILTILAAIGEILTRLFRAKEQQEHEKQQQQIKDDPAGWFDNHFNDNDNSVQANKPMPNNADQTKQTSANEHSKNE